MVLFEIKTKILSTEMWMGLEKQERVFGDAKRDLLLWAVCNKA